MSRFVFLKKIFVLCMSLDCTIQALHLFHFKVASRVLFIMRTNTCNGKAVLPGIIRKCVLNLLASLFTDAVVGPQETSKARGGVVSG